MRGVNAPKLAGGPRESTSVLADLAADDNVAVLDIGTGVVVDSVNVNALPYGAGVQRIVRADELMEVQGDGVVGDRPAIGDERQRRVRPTDVAVAPCWRSGCLSRALEGATRERSCR